MNRDYSTFPDDENGDILWGMASDGDKLETPREIDFSVVFPTEEFAIKFAVHLLHNEQKVSFSSYDGKSGFPWQVQAHPVMPAKHKNITGFELLLAKHASPMGGINDGWGCFAQE